MSYPLQQTHSVLQQCLQSSDLFAVNAKGKNDCLAPAWEEIQNFRPLFLRSAASAPSAEALRILVEVTATGCTDAMNIVSLLQQQNERRDSPPALSRLELSLGEILSWLRTCFNSYINEDMALPRSLAAKELMDIRHVLSELCAKAEVSVCREGLTLISNLVKEIFERNDALPSYRLVAYLRNLINGIRELSTSSPVDTAALDSWAKLFIRYNCNDALFIHHIIQKLSGEANDILLLPGRAEKWQWFRKEINQVLECGTALHPDAPSVKAYLLSAIGSELTWREGKESSLSSVYGSRVSATPDSTASIPLLTTLSVSQLAVWCRLLSGCDIVKHDNQTELLKMVAGALQTTRAANISADSLRAKYYSPDRSALAIVKEQLFRMINLVKEM